MRLYVSALGGIVSLLVAVGADAAQPTANPEDLQAVLKALDAPTATEPPRVFQADDGFFRFIGAPPGGRFLSPAGAKSADAATNAESFLSTHAAAFASPDPKVSLEVTGVGAANGRRYVRFKQTYGGLELFGSGVVVQLDSQGGIVSILSDVMRSLTTTGNAPLSLTPALTSTAAQQAAIGRIRADVDDAGGDQLTASQSTLMVFDPGVVGTDGPTRLVWYTEVSSPDNSALRRAVIVDAVTGQIPLHWSLIHEVKQRMVYDAGNSFLMPGTLARSEGEPATGIKDVDDAYDYLGDTYDFFMENHGRDAIDGLGGTLIATVRFTPFAGLNYENAFWSGEQMTFGLNMAVDDVAAHELTHGVTQYTSNLIYLFESGAINESFSDMWGEWVDLTNGKGLDTDEVRWLMGEDTTMGVIRNMKDPTQFGDPDRYYSPLWKDYPYYYDNGGVHSNSGVGNKLCYLLTDGDTFNGRRVDGMGIERAADLMYEVESNLLTPGSDYFDLYFALSQASINLGLTLQERLNLRAATNAVEIVPVGEGALENFRATPAYTAEGDPAIALTWTTPETAGEVILVRSTKRFSNTIPPVANQNDRDGKIVFEGPASSFVDGVTTPQVAGQQYFYSLFVDVPSGLPYAAYARATAADSPPDYLAQLFTADEPIDLSFSQLLFSPIGDPVAAQEAGQADGYYNCTNYVVSVQRNIRTLPVARNDAQGQAVALPMGDDDFLIYNLGATAFPFFGALHNRLIIASNGYIGFNSVGAYFFSNFPSLEAHFDEPRISLLFADLAPNVGGTVWGRALDDRLVITFERVPEYQFYTGGIMPGTNTAQIELFYSGHIRMTYLELNVEEAVVGLSDGKGVPPEPSAIIPNTPSELEETTFSQAPPPFSTALTLWPPIPMQIVEEGRTVEFSVTTISPAGIVPSLTAAWNLTGPAPFSDHFDGTGTFRWNTTSTDEGVHTVDIVASTPTESAYQPVSIVVLDKTVPPQALNLRLSSGDPYEEPTLDRPVSANATLTAEYDYYHPDEERDSYVYGEGRSLIYWFCNGTLMSGFINQTQISAAATRPGEEWYFTVTPETNFLVRGALYYSPRVTIVDDPLITEVTPTYGPKTGGTVVRIRGYNIDHPMKVRFGGFDAHNVRAISDDELEAVTPPRAPGAVDVEVVTPDGTARIPSAFTFTENGESIVKADVNDDGVIDAVDLQLVINAVLGIEKRFEPDANRDGNINAADIQIVINVLLNG